MKKIALIFCTLTSLSSIGQESMEVQKINSSGWFSLGARSTISTFGGEGLGIGAGGQFRIQLSNRVNTEWFADYISINMDDKVRSEYTHIGWSVMFYPFKNLQFPKVFQPYVLAGHCFDYNRKTIIENGEFKDRWGSAVQMGIGTHFNLTERFDISLSFQYMIHLTTELHAEMDSNPIEIIEEKHATLQGHMLSTVSMSYKIGKLWKK